MPKNSLKIKASTLKLEFVGEDSEIREGYEMTRELIISCFQEQLLAVEAREQALSEDSEAHDHRQRANSNTQSLHRVQQQSAQPAPRTAPRTQQAFSTADPNRSYAPPKADALSHVSVALTSDLYNKVCVLDRGEFEASILGQALSFEQIGRIYIAQDQKERFERFFTLGKVLWRELTTQGRQAVRNEPGKP